MNVDVGFIFSLLSALVCLGGLCISFGILKGKVDQSVEENKAQAEQIKHCATKEEVASLQKMVDDNRVHNSEQHQKLFDSVNSQAKEIGELNVLLNSMKESLDELKSKIQDGLKEIRDEMKELRRG